MSTTLPSRKITAPVFFVLAIYLVCLALRIFEYFVLRTDATVLGENIFHKLAGIVILFAVARYLSYSPARISAKYNEEIPFVNAFIFCRERAILLPWAR